MHSTKYIVVFVTILTTVVAVILSFLFSTWQEQSKLNEAIFNKRAILSSVKDYLDADPKTMSDEEVVELFDGKQMKQIALDMDGEELGSEEIKESGYKGGRAEDIDMAKEKKKDEEERILPLYVFTSSEGPLYIVSVRGSGLWDEIWGNIALKADFSTVAGTTFDHKGETPGLGAEIKDNPAFPAKFTGKQFLNAEGEYVGIDVVKNGSKGNPHKVDGISGATVTGVGVGEMMVRGVRYYQPYFNKIKSSQGAQMGMLNN